MNGINKFLIVIVLLQLGCSGTLTPEKYVRYFEKNRTRFCEKIERNDIIATIGYVPNEYYAARDMVFDTSLVANQALERYANSLIFILSIKSANGDNRSVLLGRNGYAGFKENVLRNTFERENDIFLLQGCDTIKVASCEYERNWGVSNEDAFVLAFPKMKLKKNIGKYHLIVRNMTSEMGTLDFKVRKLLKKAKKLKG
jgi:hypothetical protein